MTTRSADLSYELSVLREVYGNISLARIEASRLLSRLRARTEVLRCSKSALKRRKGVKAGKESTASHLNINEEYEQLRNWRDEMKNIDVLRESILKFRNRERCAENNFVETLWPHWDVRGGGSLDDSVWKPEGYKSHYHGKTMEGWNDALLSSRVMILVTAFSKWHTAISELQSARTMAVPFTISEETKLGISRAVLVYAANKEESFPFKLNRAAAENNPHHILAEQCRRSLLDFVEEQTIEALFKIVKEGKKRIDESTSNKEENLKCTLVLLRGLHSLLTNEGKPSVTFLRQYA